MAVVDHCVWNSRESARAFVVDTRRCRGHIGKQAEIITGREATVFYIGIIQIETISVAIARKIEITAAFAGEVIDSLTAREEEEQA